MKRFVWIAGPVAALALVYVFTGPYVFPTSVALGPCLKDFTSPNSYTSRSSPLKSLDLTIGEVRGRLCYGAPSSRGRRLFGEGSLVPDGRLWRLGANEPTRLFLDGTVRLGELTLDPGRYALYAEPGALEWRIFVSTSTWHWGNQITAGVRDAEVGSFVVPRVRRGTHVEQMTFTQEQGELLLSWGFTRVRIPLTPAGATP